MMLRLLATFSILLLLGLGLALPSTPLGRRGREAAARQDVATAVPAIGDPFPDLVLRELDGAPLRVAGLRGRRVVLTFERSVDW
jgi:hypothetical protein